MNYTIIGKSHNGNVREKNEDSLFHNKDFPGLYILADGIGGYEGGQEASEIVTSNATQYFSAIKDGCDNYSEQMSNYFKFVNYKIIEKQMREIRLCKMGSTATAIYFMKNKNTIYYAHIGDCRILLIRKNKCIQVTDDHNEMGELIKSGLIQKSEYNLNNKNKLTKYLGQSEEIEPDFGEFKLEKNDLVLIATDGVFGKIGNEKIKNFIIRSMNTKMNPEKATEELAANLMKYCLKNDGSDNITFIMLYYY